MIKQFFEKIEQRARERQIKKIEDYLGHSVDLEDLERRQRELTRKGIL